MTRLRFLLALVFFGAKSFFLFSDIIETRSFKNIDRENAKK